MRTYFKMILPTSSYLSIVLFCSLSNASNHININNVAANHNHNNVLTNVNSSNNNAINFGSGFAVANSANVAKNIQTTRNSSPIKPMIALRKTAYIPKPPQIPSIPHIQPVRKVEQPKVVQPVVRKVAPPAEPSSESTPTKPRVVQPIVRKVAPPAEPSSESTPTRPRVVQPIYKPVVKPVPAPSIKPNPAQPRVVYPTFKKVLKQPAEPSTESTQEKPQVSYPSPKKHTAPSEDTCSESSSEQPIVAPPSSKQVAQPIEQSTEYVVEQPKVVTPTYKKVVKPPVEQSIEYVVEQPKVVTPTYKKVVKPPVEPRTEYVVEQPTPSPTNYEKDPPAPKKSCNDPVEPKQSPAPQKLAIFKNKEASRSIPEKQKEGCNKKFYSTSSVQVGKMVNDVEHNEYKYPASNLSEYIIKGQEEKDVSPNKMKMPDGLYNCKEQAKYNAKKNENSILKRNLGNNAKSTFNLIHKFTEDMTDDKVFGFKQQSKNSRIFRVDSPTDTIVFVNLLSTTQSYYLSFKMYERADDSFFEMENVDYNNAFLIRSDGDYVIEVVPNLTIDPNPFYKTNSGEFIVTISSIVKPIDELLKGDPIYLNIEGARGAALFRPKSKILLYRTDTDFVDYGTLDYGLTPYYNPNERTVSIYYSYGSFDGSARKGVEITINCSNHPSNFPYIDGNKQAATIYNFAMESKSICSLFDIIE